LTAAGGVSKHVVMIPIDDQGWIGRPPVEGVPGASGT
jgi:hypothetical protein